MLLSLRRRHPIADAGPGLIAQARDGDRDAAQRLIDEHAARVGAIAGAILGPDSPEVPDAVQETLVRALDRLHQCRTEDGFPAWLTRIAQNVCRNRLRAARSARLSPEPPPERAARTPDRDASLDLRAAMERLRDDERLVVVLHHAHGYTCDEIGGMLGQDAEAVRSRIRRATARLRTQMEDRQ